jgi:hypothetical protein
VNNSVQTFERRPDFLRKRYDHFINGKWTKPVKGRYFTDSSPLDQAVLADVARGSAEDVELALDAAHAAKEAWGQRWSRFFGRGCKWISAGAI